MDEKSESKADLAFDEIDDRTGSCLTSVILIRLAIIGGRKKKRKPFATDVPIWKGVQLAPHKAYNRNAGSKFPVVAYPPNAGNRRPSSTAHVAADHANGSGRMLTHRSMREGRLGP